MFISSIDSLPRKCLPQLGTHGDESDYIYYDRESSDKSASIMSVSSPNKKETSMSSGEANKIKGS